MEPPLETPYLLIREVRKPDATAFLAYMRTEPYWRHLPIDPPTAASIESMIASCLLDQQKEPRTNYLLAAVDKPSGELIGEGILRVRSARWRQDEIGWGIAPDRTGHGLGTEIGAAMLNLGFETLGLHRIYAQCRLKTTPPAGSWRSSACVRRASCATTSWPAAYGGRQSSVRSWPRTTAFLPAARICKQSLCPSW